ncbi:2,3-butanediol dehydrogenase [Georgenia faecalis]|uniref:2,3-butanediol dehydrogenase n=1 Tax=Georgenia faecalis TaxID=2483799 RepID=UPI000FDAB6D1|nr:2,3-butanediol dehydrogenase [Georgenia faecalis]
MKAVRYYGKEDLRIEDVPEQELVPGTVRIAPAWTGICGSDLHLYLDGPLPPAPSTDQPHPISGETLPVTLGHEFSGVVEELGEGVDDLAVGDHVVVEPLMVCGECGPCQEGRYNLCVKMGFIGISGRGGGLSEHIVVERRFVHPVGDMPLDQAALIEPLAVAVHAVRLSGATTGDLAVVGGAGPIGLLTAAVLKATGATVVVSEPSAARRERAASVADHVVDPGSEDLVAKVAELSGGEGAAVAYECAGVPAVLNVLLDVLKPGGVLQVVALFSGRPEINIAQVLMKELDVRGAIGYAGDHEYAIRLVQEGKVDVAPLITGRIAADDIVEQGYRTLVNDKEHSVKILVHM